MTAAHATTLALLLGVAVLALLADLPAAALAVVTGVAGHLGTLAWECATGRAS